MKAHDIPRVRLSLIAPLALLPSLAFGQTREAAGAADADRADDPFATAGESAQLFWGDYDADGLGDALAIGAGGDLTLLRNVGDGSFSDETSTTALDSVRDAAFAVWRDFDGDGQLDLLVGSRSGPAGLLQNLSGTFVDVTREAGIEAQGPHRSAHWIDYDGDELLDLHLVGEVENTLYHALEGGVFEAISLPAVQPQASLDAPRSMAPSDSTEGAPASVAPVATDPLGDSAGELPSAGGGSSASASSSVVVVSGAGNAPTESVLACATSLDDANGGGCLQASSSATLGMLYPLSGKFFVDEATGHIGVGTTAPASRLHVADGSTGALVDSDARLVVERTGGSGTAWIQVLTATGNEAGILFGNPAKPSDGGLIWHDQFDELQVQADGDIKMVVESNGRVGIGTTAPSHPLEVVGKVLFGTNNVSSANDTTVSGGRDNSATGNEATVGGGMNNTASGSKATVAGGSTNNATGDEATVAGGAANDATADYATVPGGFINKATGEYSFAAGFGAKASHDGAFVWADSVNDSNQTSSAVDEFNVYADGGVRMFAAGSASPSMIVSGSGLVGIGTASPNRRLTVQDTGSGDVVQLLSSQGGSDYHLDFGPAGLEFVETGVAGQRFVLEDGGNVGINTGNPAFTLEVNGSAGKPGGGSWSVSSDLRLKKNVADLEGALTTLLGLRGVTFEYVDPEAVNELDGERIGFIAQEVETVLPDWVEEVDGYKRLTIRGFEALAVEALRELAVENDALRAKSDALETRVARLESIEDELVGLRSALASSATR